MKSTAPVNASGENPLVPHRLLRQMFAAMLELQLVSRHAGRERRKAAGSDVGGFEAALTAVLLGLKPGDMVLDATGSPAVEHLLETTLPDLLVSKAAAVSRAGTGVPALPLTRLPFLADGEKRLSFALGAAACARAAGRHQAVVAYAGHREIGKSEWRWALTHAAQHELPVLFVVLPRQAENGGNGHRGVSELARKSGVPGIPVDGWDSIALYRVAQESLGRIRGGDGPVVMECVSYKLPGKQQKEASDPVTKLKQHLLETGIAEAAWMTELATDISGRLPETKPAATRRK